MQRNDIRPPTTAENAISAAFGDYTILSITANDKNVKASHTR